MGNVYKADITQQGAKNTKSFNNNLRYVQGFRTAIAQGISNTTVNLNSSGKFLLGISVIPINQSDISDCQMTLSINNNNLLLNTGLNNVNPNFVQGMIYLPTPQPLQGNDTINLQFNRSNSGATINVTVNFFYVPR